VPAYAHEERMSAKWTTGLLTAATLLVIGTNGASAGTNMTADEWCLKHGLLKGCQGFTTANRGNTGASNVTTGNTSPPNPGSANTQSSAIFDRWGNQAKTSNTGSSTQTHASNGNPGNPK